MMSRFLLAFLQITDARPTFDFSPMMKSIGKLNLSSSLSMFFLSSLLSQIIIDPQSAVEQI